MSSRSESTSARFANPRAVAAWLLVCCAMVFAMIVVGGATRLTHSGLSITEWQPIVGTLPPLSAQDWQDAFDKYKVTPEYRKVNAGMSMDAFKGIFWWEYFHRLLGRTIGAIFLLPLLWFWWRGGIDAQLRARLVGIFILGGLQGAMGWYMVQSGLVDDPRVSQFRLTAHLLLAFAILALMLWTAMALLRHDEPARGGGPGRLWRLAWLITAVTCYMLATGGFVAGIRAGRAYNTFPLMNGSVIPPEILMLEPWWKNFFYNMATVQFDHRIGAWLLAVLAPMVWWRAHGDITRPGLQAACNLLLGTLAIQIALGIYALLMVVPIGLAVAHQAGAVLLFCAALNLNHVLRQARTTQPA